jgi:post-segregation antitoxin (ccd killing protein)
MKRLTISVPDDVAERVGAEDNASRFFTELARREMDRESDRRWMAEHGVSFTEEGVRRAGVVLAEARERMSAQAWAALRGGPAVYAAYLAGQRPAT